MDGCRSTLDWQYLSDQRSEPTGITIVSASGTTAAVKVNMVHRRCKVARPNTYMLSTGEFGRISEKKQKERIAMYNSYAVEGKMKDSIRTSFRWVKNKYSTFVHGYY